MRSRSLIISSHRSPKEKYPSFLRLLSLWCQIKCQEWSGLPCTEFLLKTPLTWLSNSQSAHLNWRLNSKLSWWTKEWWTRWRPLQLCLEFNPTPLLWPSKLQRQVSGLQILLWCLRTPQVPQWTCHSGCLWLLCSHLKQQTQHSLSLATFTLWWLIILLNQTPL